MRRLPFLLVLALALAGLSFVERGEPARATDLPIGAVFVPLSQFRVFDTRDGAPVDRDTSFDVVVTGERVPMNAVAVVMNLTYVNATGDGYVTVWPAGRPRPNVSTLNKTGAGPVPNSVTVKVGEGGKVSIFNHGSVTDLFADVAGYYMIGSTDDTSGLPGPQGERGEPGPAGEQGVAGVDGAPGEQGSQGPDGLAPGRLPYSLSAPIEDVGPFAQMAIGADGLPIVAFIDDANQVQVAHCDDAACTSTTNEVVAETVFRVRVSLAIGADHFPVIAYRDLSSRLVVAHCLDELCADTEIQETSAVIDEDIALVIGADGFPLVTAHSAVTTLVAVHCLDRACQSSETATMTTSFTGRHSSVAIARDGNPVVVYENVGENEVWLTRCTNKACSTGFHEAIDAVDGFGMGTAVAIGRDGWPIVAYANSDGTLEIVHCADEGCGSRSSVAVGAGVSLVVPPSVTIGADGLAAVSFLTMAGEVQLAHCDDVACSSAHVATMASGAATEFVTAGVGTDRLPVVMFLGTAHDLRIVHCSNAFCVPYARGR